MSGSESDEEAEDIMKEVTTRYMASRKEKCEKQVARLWKLAHALVEFNQSNPGLLKQEEITAVNHFLKIWEHFDGVQLKVPPWGVPCWMCGFQITERKYLECEHVIDIGRASLAQVSATPVDSPTEEAEDNIERLKKRLAELESSLASSSSSADLVFPLLAAAAAAQPAVVASGVRTSRRASSANSEAIAVAQAALKVAESKLIESRKKEEEADQDLIASLRTFAGESRVGRPPFLDKINFNKFYEYAPAHRCCNQLKSQIPLLDIRREEVFVNFKPIVEENLKKILRKIVDAVIFGQRPKQGCGIEPSLDNFIAAFTKIKDGYATAVKCAKDPPRGKEARRGILDRVVRRAKIQPYTFSSESETESVDTPVSTAKLQCAAAKQAAERAIKILTDLKNTVPSVVDAQSEVRPLLPSGKRRPGPGDLELLRQANLKAVLDGLSTPQNAALNRMFTDWIDERLHLTSIMQTMWIDSLSPREHILTTAATVVGETIESLGTDKNHPFVARQSTHPFWGSKGHDQATINLQRAMSVPPRPDVFTDYTLELLPGGSVGPQIYKLTIKDVGLTEIAANAIIKIEKDGTDYYIVRTAENARPTKSQKRDGSVKLNEFFVEFNSLPAGGSIGPTGTLLLIHSSAKKHRKKSKRNKSKRNKSKRNKSKRNKSKRNKSKRNKSKRNKSKRNKSKRKTRKGTECRARKKTRKKIRKNAKRRTRRRIHKQLKKSRRSKK